MVPIVAHPPGVSANPPGALILPCRGCGGGLSLDARSERLAAGVGYEPWCFGCAAARWPDLEVVGSEGAYVSTEEVNGVRVGTIRVGRLRLRDVVAGAKRV